MLKEGALSRRLLHLNSGAIAPEDSASVNAANAEAHVGHCESVAGCEVVILPEVNVIPPQKLHPVRGVCANKPRVRGSEVVIHLDAAWEGIGGIQNVDRIV